MQRLAIITPVFNESVHIDRVAAAMAAQTRRPDVWLVIDDGSTDETLERLRKWESELDFMRVMSSTDDADFDPAADRLAIALEAQAFNRALATLELSAFTHVGKLDGDVELPAEWFVRTLERFEGDPKLGISGGCLVEPEGARVRPVKIPPYHVHGALKTYSRECFEGIGGMQEQLAWDTIDETKARMLGFTTRSFDDLVALHLRPSASAGGQLRGRARHGECAWILHYSVPWILMRSAKVALQRPRVLSGIFFVWGYASAAARRVPRVSDREFRAFTRRELRSRILRRLRIVPAAD
jgi:glycosyltransferase involved in cell wall biosynthesis